MLQKSPRGASAPLRSDEANRTEMEPRRFPPPWAVEETEACFIVKDHAGQALAYAYFEEEPGRRAAAKLLTLDEARRIAANIAKSAGSVAALASRVAQPALQKPQRKPESQRWPRMAATGASSTLAELGL